MGESDKIYNGLRAQSAITLIFSALQLVYFSFMSRLLNEEEFGLFAVLTGVTAILMAVTEAGLGASVIQRKDITPSYISTAFTLSVLLGVVSMLALCALSPILSNLIVGSYVLTVAFCIMAFDLLLTNVISIMRALYMRNLDFFKYGMFEIVACLMSSIIGIWMAYKGHGLYAIVLSMVLNHLLTCVILVVLNYGKVSWIIDWKCVTDIFSYGGWLTASVILRSVAEQLDKMVLSAWLSVSQLGIYNRPAGIISQLSNKAFGIFDVILFPILSSLQDDKEKTRSAYLKSTELIVILSVFFSLAMILCSDLIIDIFLGAKWVNLVTLIQIMIINLVFLAISRIQDCFFRSLGYTKMYFASRLILCFTTLFALYIGCQYGIEAVAMSLIVVRMVEVAIKIVYLSSKIGVSLYRTYTSFIKVSWLLIVAFIPIYIFKTVVADMPLLTTGVYMIVVVGVLMLHPHILGENFYSYVWMKMETRMLAALKVNKKAEEE